MAEKKNLLTDKGLKKLEDELQELRVVKRKEVAQKIKEAREQGDLSENAEYDAAKDEQKDIEARIEELESILKNVEVIYSDEVDSEKVNVGCAVTVKRLESGNVEKFKLVGSTEADFLNNKISNESPIGSALMGSKVGEIVEVETPSGTFQIEILEISLDDE
ncbi:MAG: transcription elongation factor GreA [Lachnospiraceae bacterium]|jgi:transcription elongation factor GreA|nr:transcription elongation factor GreA [Lachnospiraceae bacterium]